MAFFTNDFTERLKQRQALEAAEAQRSPAAEIIKPAISATAPTEASAAVKPSAVGSVLSGLSGAGSAAAANPWVGGAMVAANLAGAIFKARAEKKKAMNKTNVEGFKGAAQAKSDAISNILSKLR